VDQRGIARGLFDASEAAAYLGISRSKLYQLLVPHGDLPIVKIGKCTRISVRALDAWIAGQEQARQRAEAG
jgi:excisionase family DNA binding protein